MFTKLSRRGFTLIEVLITLSIFSVVAIMCVNLLVNGLRSAKKIQAQIYLYSEAQALIDQMARDIESNTVDYETYYSREVLAEDQWDTPNYGYYAKSFFDPGSDGLFDGPYVDSALAGLYGTTCSDGTAYPDNCSLPEYDTQDQDTGTHPFDEIDTYTTYTDDPTYMNAFCQGSTGHGSIDCTEVGVPFTDELFLINQQGDMRILYALRLLDSSTTEYGLARVVMTGTDSDGDGIEDLWTCTSSYDCNDTGESGQATPWHADTQDFAPVSPQNISITNFAILISPSEDPYRGFGEEDAQLQPQVTLILEVTLSDDYGSVLGDVPSILIQRTVSTGVYSKVVSYE